MSLLIRRCCIVYYSTMSPWEHLARDHKFKDASKVTLQIIAYRTGLVDTRLMAMTNVTASSLDTHSTLYIEKHLHYFQTNRHNGNNAMVLCGNNWNDLGAIMYLTFHLYTLHTARWQYRQDTGFTRININNLRDYDATTISYIHHGNVWQQY